MRIDIDYNGAFPNLCSGDLVVTIDGFVWIFPQYCLSSGGHVAMTDDGDWYTDRQEWNITEWPIDFPENLKEQVLDEVNSMVSWGCCGGCT